MKADYHVHSYYSNDSKTPLRTQAEKAYTVGLDELCFTEHVDYGTKQDIDSGMSIQYIGNEPLTNADYPKYFAELEEVRRDFQGKLVIRAGLEFGVQTHTVGQYNTLFEKYRDKLDFILLSIHQVDNLGFWTQDFQRGKTQEEYNQAYYNEMLRVMQTFHNYSVLAHLDLIRRYDLQGRYPFAKIRDIVAAILTQAINDNKGIELNTSGWRYGLNGPQPCLEILELYHDLGGKIITLGSDAHSPDYIADHMDEARKILRDIGFKTFCTFEKMTPSFHVL